MDQLARVFRARRFHRFRKTLRPLRRVTKAAYKHVYWNLYDTVRNYRCARRDRRILILRHVNEPQYYEVIIDWLAEHHHDVRSHFELRVLPCVVRRWSAYALCVPWLQDPVQQWSASAYRHADKIARLCEARGIRVINPVDRLVNATKCEGARRIGSVGLRVPRIVRILDPERFRDDFYGIDPPLIVREDWGHGGLMVKVDTAEEARAVDLTRFERPIAVEFVDVSDPSDGIYRKYRYVAAGDTGLSLSLHATREWLTRGKQSLMTPQIIADETAFVTRPDPNHEALQRAGRALELDFVAFDYGYDRDGRTVVWEANPFPIIHLPKQQIYWARRGAYIRLIQALVRLYLQRADLPVPPSIDEALGAYQSSSEQ